MSSDLASMSATEAIAKFRAHDLAPVDLLEAVIARSEDSEPEIWFNPGSRVHERG